MAFKGGSNALAAMLKQRSETGMTQITEENISNVPAAARPVGLTKQVSISTAPAKCVACSKSVFKMEEIIAIGGSWHGSCFTCGGTANDGCKRKLVRDGFVENHGQPYCSACFDKNKTKRAEERKEEVEKIARPLSMMLLKKQAVAEELPAAIEAAKKGNESEINGRLNAVMNGDFLAPAEFTRRPLPPVPPTAAAVAHANATLATPKCPICEKSVYKMEEIIAVGRSWHATCFVCGAGKTDGCKRKLVRDGFAENQGTPYCKTCYDRQFKSWVKASKEAAGDSLSNMLVNKRTSAKLLAGSIATGSNNVTEESAAKATAAAGAPPSSVLSRVLASNAAAASLYGRSTVPQSAPTWNKAGSNAAKYTVGKTTPFNPANKCVKCAKTVYKMEETIAVGQVWHNGCFCCGGLNADGCARVLSRDSYVDHNGQPYCNACFNKQFRTKGFGIGTELNTDYGVK